MTNNNHFKPQKSPKVKAYSYLVLIFVILFFSGYFSGGKNWLSFMDFQGLIGKFGTMKTSTVTFVGSGGSGACQGFIFALSLIPGIMLALGVVEVAEHLGALHAAQHLLTPLMRPLLGIPGVAGLALVSSLQSSDAAGAMTRELYDKNLISDKERSIFGSFQFSGGAAITNYLTNGAALFPFLSISIITPLGVILFYKVIGTNIMRLYINIVSKKHAVVEQKHD